VEAATELLQAGAVGRAVTALKKAEALNPNASLFADAEIWNRFCWLGSLQGDATEVMFACEKAVSLKPKGADVLNSRGVARALTGDLPGAIADFQASLPAVTHDQEKAQRRKWVEVLQSGQNPFTKAELARLQQDPLE
jgi:Flp pilus assembly protein TadD